MPRPRSEKRVLVAYTVVGLAVGVLLSVVLVWNFVDRYYWRSDGSLNTYPAHTGPRNRVWDPATGDVDLRDNAGSRSLTRSEKVWIGCQESAPIWFVGGVIGFGVGMIHLRLRCRSRERAQDPEQQSYDDAVGRIPRPPAP